MAAVGCVALASLAATMAAAADDILPADFEGDTYGAWTATGDALSSDVPEPYARANPGGNILRAA